MKNLSVAVRIRIVELPSRQKTFDLFAQRAVGKGPCVLLTELGMNRKFREHPDQPVRNRLPLGIGGGLDDIDDGVHRHPARGVEHERASLRRVAAHFEQSAQRFRLQRFDQPRRATAQGGAFRSRR
jgi:hypothetical protein